MEKVLLVLYGGSELQGRICILWTSGPQHQLFCSTDLYLVVFTIFWCRHHLNVAREIRRFHRGMKSQSNFVVLVDRYTLSTNSSLENVAPLSSIFCLNNPFILLFFLHLFSTTSFPILLLIARLCCCCFLLIKYLPYHKKYKSKFETKTCFSSMTKQALERKA